MGAARADGELLDLVAEHSRAWRVSAYLWAGWSASGERPELQPLVAKADEREAALCDRIVGAPASTLDGIVAKVEAMALVSGPSMEYEPETWVLEIRAVALAVSIIRDVRTLRGLDQESETITTIAAAGG